MDRAPSVYRRGRVRGSGDQPRFAGSPLSAERVAKIRARLEAAFVPDVLEIVDDSHRHAGHAGAKDGRGHFSVTIVSAKFAGTKPLDRHRMIYAALGNLMQTDIHALSVNASVPGQNAITSRRIGMARFVGGLITASLAALSGACTQSSAPGATDAALGPGQVATVNGQRIPESLFRVYALSAMRKNADELTPDERKAVIDDLVGIILMADEAQKQGLLGERTIAAQLELARMQLAARAMATRYLEQETASDSRAAGALRRELAAPRGAGIQSAAHPR